MASGFDFQAIVDDAARIIESEDAAHVTPEAREVLIVRAHAHDAEVEWVAREQGLTRDQLVKAATAQLREGLPPHRAIREPQPPHVLGFTTRAREARAPIDPDRAPRRIDARAVQLGMERKCWFVPWC